MKKLTEQILNSKIPTRLVVGSVEQTQKLTEHALQFRFCSQKSNNSNIEDCFCSECRKIKKRQHPFLVWLSTEKDYVVSDLDVIFDTTRFALDANREFFFVIDKAHTLNIASANKILKILEEPPFGYKFILLTDNKNLIIPTILSRCFIIQIKDNVEEIPIHPLLNFFIKSKALPNPDTFDKELKKQQLSENQSMELCQTLLEYFIKKVSEQYEKSASIEEIERSFFHTGINILNKRLKNPPASGGSNMFWKLLYLDFSML